MSPSKTAIATAFNFLHDLETDHLRRMLDHLLVGMCKATPTEKLLLTQVEYVVKQRERSGDPSDKRPWRKTTP